MEKKEILDIKISVLKKDELSEIINKYLEEERNRFIVTPNPEFILEAQSDEEFYHILNSADMAIPDGIGLKFAGWLSGVNFRRVAGVDVLENILEISENKGIKVAIVNWAKAFSTEEEINKSLKLKFPKLDFKVFNIHNERLNEPIQKKEGETELKKLATDLEIRENFFEEVNLFEPKVLVTTFGAPFQEKFIFHHKKELPSVKLGIGVGGSLDFFTNKTKRAPAPIRAFGFEWLWRLAVQPWRIKRIFRAVIIFPLKFMHWKFIQPFLYRPNVICFSYKRENDKFKVLLVERQEQLGHWQLPQGGTDGENINRAGLREIREETNCNKFIVKATYKNIWKYKFEKYLSGEKIIGRKHKGYKGQKQSLCICEFIGNDDDIKINFWEHSAWKWVDSEEILEKIYPTRREVTKICLEKFNKLIKNK